MRTPNCGCVVCGKPLYRRPGHMAKVRHVACMAHRAQAQKLSGITEAQNAGLSLGRVKGTNHLTGIPKSEESKIKRSKAMKDWAGANPDLLAARSEKVRGNLHYRWKGGTSKLNLSIRQMTENRKWMDAVKERDGKCLKCGATADLESHHIVPLSSLIESLGIRNREDARRHNGALWDLNNGETLCQRCHFDEHGRTYIED